MANKVFFDGDFLALEKPPQRIARHDDAAFAQVIQQSMECQAWLFFKTLHQPIALLLQQKRPLAAHCFAAALPVNRARCAHFTTLATLTSNAEATARAVSPSATIATTRSRRSRD